jgi:adenine-specific DNA-methyltransferase
MTLKELKPRKALNKAFLKVKPNRSDIEGFKANLITLLDRTNDTESEEFHKNLVAAFLNDTYYKPNHFINTKGRNDQVIHNGPNPDSTVGVIIEAKKPGNKGEMLTRDNINRKAFHELVLYYLRERITHKNLEIKHLVATNINEWFIFDATLFDRLFAQNKHLVKQFNDFEGGRLADTKTDFFYSQVAEPFIESITQEIEFTWFDIREYEKPLRNQEKKDDNKLIALFKLLSPEHLLKLPFANDSNSLDKRFYSELLHIIGLTETRQGSKKLIERNPEGQRNEGSMLENAILQLDSMDLINNFDKPQKFGASRQERLFNVALELCITWINRILFLKLLEAQLLSYHKKDKVYEFLSIARVPNYDVVNKLFFQVLAKKKEERSESVNREFGLVPFLNSSLFETSEVEQKTLRISGLEPGLKIPVFASTVLRDDKGKKISGELDPLEYLFMFLNAYDFSSEGSEEIQEDNKTLINASVLGLIFEKINGYKDGSFFTPGFITMYMCRETIRRAVVQKFNETKNWSCSSIDELYDKIDDRNEANQIVNSIKICDPAVGSGHFLVSALNEMIAVKNDLKILQDRDGRRLKEYHVEVVNDELIVTDEDGELFEYNPNSKESQRIQETLFHEKQTIIENCLFGVDINPNSVKICRLRLWIELLKNAYYVETLHATSLPALETLPNIDINIKCGNSLVSRFAIDADLKQALKKSKWSIDSYRLAVATYRNAETKEQKREMERLIADIKSDFRSEISLNDDKVKKLRKLTGDLFQMTNQHQLFEMTEKEKADWNKKLQQLTAETQKLEAEIEEIKNNKIFENAFEWRFEFPEVLNDEGDFVGFDVVIGNPPYVNAMELKKSLSEPEYHFYKNNFTTAKGSIDLYIYFFELGYKILRTNYFIHYISPNRFLSASYGLALRELILNKTSLLKIGDYSNVKVFKEASTYPITTLFQKVPNNHNLTSFTFIEEFHPIKYRSYRTEDLFSLNEFILGFVLSEKYEIVRKIISQSVPLGNCGTINATSTAKEADEFNSLINENAGFKLINTGTIDKFSNTWGNSYLVDKKKKFLKPYLPKSETALGKNRFELYSNPKIIFAKIAITPEAFYDENGEYASVNTNCIHNFSNDYLPEYILGWVNSRLFQYLFECFFDGLKMSGGYLLYSSPNLLNTYIKQASKLEQKRIAVAVRKVIDSKKEVENPQNKDLEAQIDQLVYELYGLTEEEIAIVESATK